MSEEASGRARRRLAAILVAGHSRLFPGDEVESFAELRAVLTDIIAPLSAQHGGKIFKQTGEIALLEFESVVEAARCAAALRQAVAEKNRGLAHERRIALRIGINLGDVIIEGGDVFGDGVNIAARLEALAEPGSVFVSADRPRPGGRQDRIRLRPTLDPESLEEHPPAGSRLPHGRGCRRQTAGAAALPTIGFTVNPAGFDDRRAIAVLPFANFSGDPEQEFFADGITEDIITDAGAAGAAFR